MQRAWLATALALVVVSLIWRFGSLQSLVDPTPARPPLAAGGIVPVRGRVVELDQRPTAGAVVILWPVVVGSADHKIPAAELTRAADDAQAAESLTRQVRGMGGDLALTDASGDYQLRVVSGDYYWMVVDCDVEPTVPKMASRAMAELGRYLADVPTLTRHHRTAWRQLHIREQLPLDYTWEATR